MPIEFPTYEDIVNRSRVDISRLIPDLDPTIYGSFIRGVVDSQSGRAFDIVLLQQQLLNQMFPQTADGEFLEKRWAAYEGLTRNPATPSTGSIVITGDPTSVDPTIPAGTLFTTPDGNQVATQVDSLVSWQLISVSSLTRVGNEVTATTTSDHGLASNIEITIGGAVEADYNGDFQITVTGTNEFTYEIDATPTTPATGIILALFGGVSAEVESIDTGSDQNLESGAKLTIVSPISGIDPTAYVDFNGLTGAIDIETDAELLIRVLQSRSNPVANFNEAAIEKEARKVSGVTRVKVKRVTPEIGDVTILFVRDNDASIIPDAGEVTAVKDAILEIAPANTPDASVIVTAPTPVSTNYTFTSISPDTTTMRAAIQANIEALYRDSVTFETDVTEDKYRSAIIDTIDPETGDELTAFALSSPSGDISVSTDEIGTLGDIIFP